TAVLGLIFFAAILPASAQSTSSAYRLTFEPRKDITQKDQDESGKSGTFVTVRFMIDQVQDTTEDVQRDYKILIKEDGVEVLRMDVPRPNISDDFSVVLSADMSGSMTEGGKVRQAKKAGGVFFDKLPAKAECGLIIFDHELRLIKAPTKNRNEI